MIYTTGFMPERFAEYDRAVLEGVHDEIGRIDLAVITQMDFGHTDPFFVLPYGVAARIDPAANARIETPCAKAEATCVVSMSG